MKTLEELSSGRRKEYFPPCTSHVTVGLEGCGLLASSKDLVVKIANEEGFIDRQGAIQSDKLDGGSIVEDNPFDLDWK